MGGVFTSSYLSEDADMLAAEAAYCELEQELQYELDHYEALHPGYDEYRFDLDEIEHDPYVLISILTAFHEGVFTIDEVQDELQMLFEKQYILTQTVEVEVRYRTETRTDSEGNDYDVEVPYNYYICKVKLEKLRPIPCAGLHHGRRNAFSVCGLYGDAGEPGRFVPRLRLCRQVHQTANHL